MVLRDPPTLCAALAVPSHGPASGICRSSRWQAFSVTEPVFDPATRVERLYCLDCDDEMAHVTELYPEGVPPSECVVEQLRGEYLSFKNQGVHANCDCFESDPYPAEDRVAGRPAPSPVPFPARQLAYVQNMKTERDMRRLDSIEVSTPLCGSGNPSSILGLVNVLRNAQANLKQHIRNAVT